MRALGRLARSALPLALGVAGLVGLAWTLSGCGVAGAPAAATSSSTAVAAVGSPSTASTAASSSTASAAAATASTSPAAASTPTVTEPGGPTPTSAPAVELPPVGSSVTLPSMTAAVVPAGMLIEEQKFGPAGKQPARLVIDPRAHIGFEEMVTAGNVAYPGFVFTIFDDRGHTAMADTNLEVLPYYVGAAFAQIVGRYDDLSGKTATVTGHQTVDGRQTFVAKTTLTFTDEEGQGGYDVDVTATVDPVTDLIVRQEYRAEGSIDWRAERQVVEATPELLYRMDVRNMADIVAGYRRARESGLKDLPFPVYGLPQGYRGLPLTWVIPHPDKGMVRLQYGEPGPGDYIAVTTLDLREDPGYDAKYLAPLDQAWIDPESSGDLGNDHTELRFGVGGIGIQIQAPKDIIRQVARDVIVVGGATEALVPST
jgi:hypothetical protein